MPFYPRDHKKGRNGTINSCTMVCRGRNDLCSRLGSLQRFPVDPQNAYCSAGPQRSFTNPINSESEGSFSAFAFTNSGKFFGLRTIPSHPGQTSSER